MRNRCSSLFVALVAIAVVALGADISADYDHKTDFSQFHTYSWIGVKAGDQLWQDRIMSAVDNQLAAKGSSKVASGGDASVSAFGRTREQDTLQTFYEGFPGWGWYGFGGEGMSTTYSEPTRVGSVTVDIFSGSTRHLIWRGRAEDVLSPKPEKNEKKLDKSITDMFKKFPPNQKG